MFATIVCSRLTFEKTAGGIMSIELKMLGWSVCLGLLYVIIAASLATQQRGLKWNTGNRDGELKSLTGAAAVYIIGIPYLRTLVWGVSIFGLLMVVAVWL
jgi:uncharacterized MAPEG superfamily protein